MHRMTGYDAQFIYDDSPDEPQHTLKIAFLGAEASATYSFARAKADMQARLEHLPPLRWRAVRVPFDLHHPVWVDDLPVNLDHHVRRLAIPAPGGRRELCEVISEIASVSLDPSKPLWENWFLEGFEGDRVVSVLKISHAVVDGGSSKELLERALSDEPTDPRRVPGVGSADDPGATRERDATPSGRRLVGDAMVDLARDVFVGTPRLVRAARDARARRRRECPPGATLQPLSSPLRAPRHVFGGRLSRRRSFHFATLPLADARRVKLHFGVTVNDVLLAVVAGAVRRYLQERGELPAEAIVGNILGSTRTPEQQGTFGNRLTSRFLSLPTHLDDPVARLEAAHVAAAAVKRDMALRSGAHIEHWIELCPPVLVKLLSRLLRIVARLTDVSGGVVVSNVAGPQRPLYAGRAPVENFISVGHMKFVAGLNVTVWSYAGNLNFGFYACREAVPDLWRIARYVEDAMHELGQTVGAPCARAA